MTSRFVNYDASAQDYATHRRPAPEVLAVWGGAVSPYVPSGSVTLDLGSGTGAFSAALLEWGSETVIAAEPSFAMARMAPDVAGVVPLLCRAEAIPLAAASCDVVWISTAFHHFGDRLCAVREIHRVLRPGGHMIIRGLVPGHSELRWLKRFPGHERALARFVDAATIHHEAGRRGGLQLVQRALPVEAVHSHDQRADFVLRMRHADTILTALTDAEIEAGVRALQATPDETEPFALSCLVYRRPASAKR